MGLYIPLQFVREQALRLGFQGCGAAKVERIEGKLLDEWLSAGFHAKMQYMESHRELRLNPEALVPKAETVFSFFVSYNGNAESVSQNALAAYALGEDYHKVLKTKLHKLMQVLQETYPDFQGRAFVDSAPVLERLWAERAGLGWIGKNGMLVNERYGSRILLGEIVCNCQSDHCERAKPRCGNCKRCLESCPNGAIKPNGLVDSNLCASYHTIESKETIPSGIRLGGKVFGCDVCLDACIWNRKAERYTCKAFSPTPQISNLIAKLHTSDLQKSDFNKARKVSAMERIKYEKLLSNLSALQNT